MTGDYNQPFKMNLISFLGNEIFYMMLVLLLSMDVLFSFPVSLCSLLNKPEAWLGETYQRYRMADNALSKSTSQPLYH